MPPTRAVSTPELGIRLKGVQTEYAPGDTIAGCVYRNSHLMTENSSLSIQLVGRTKTKTSMIDENMIFRHRSGFNLIPRETCTRKLHEGELRVVGDGDEVAWDFEITLPKYVNPEYLGNWDQSQSYLPINATDHPLPSTFTLFGDGKTEVFVEYFLKAGLRNRERGYIGRWDAQLPLTVTHRDPPIVDCSQPSRYIQSIVSYRLIPGMKKASFSLSQTIKQAMNTSSVPKLGFELQVHMPGVIRLNNPTPIPVRLQAVPDWNHTTEDMRNMSHKIKLKWVSMEIVATTDVLCEGPHTKQEESEINLEVMEQLDNLETPVYIPCTDVGSFVDIGRLIDLRLDRYINACLQHQGPAPFTPTFVTYNIRVTHRLKWSLIVEVAGQIFEAMGAKMLVILGPSQELSDLMPAPRD